MEQPKIGTRMRGDEERRGREKEEGEEQGEYKREEGRWRR